MKVLKRPFRSFLLSLAPLQWWLEGRWYLGLQWTTLMNLFSLRYRHKLSQLRRRGGLKLNLGCADRPRKGWINVDALRFPGVDILLDLRRRLPFVDDSAGFIFMEHVLEHFDLDDARRLLSECHRVLKPGGVMRLVVPDGEKYLRAYSEGNIRLIGQLRPGASTSMMAINDVFLQGWQHKFTYDFETLALVCGEAGFRNLYRCKPKNGRFDEVLDSEDREAESLYVEGVK